MTTDSEKLLTEKLDLSRQLSTLKPELDHLRAQVEANSDLLSEKLALQRQLSEIQVQLDHAKSEAKRAIAKRRNTQHDLNQQDTIDDLRKALTREKRLREKAQEDLEVAQADLEREKENAQRKNTTEAAKAEEDANVQVETEELRRQLAKERKERERSEKTHQKTQSDWDATKAILDDKLNQFRTKLKSTKERLKETESQLEEAQQAVAAASRSKSAAPTAVEQPAKQTKKRSAAQMDPDSQKLGTPGNAKPAKKGRKAAAVGDKSTFSITPFLNRTMSAAPESPEQDEAPAEAAADASDSEVEIEADSPSAAAIKSTTESASTKPLATVPASKSNIKKAKAEPKTKKAKAKQALEQVVEEVEPASQEEPAATTTKVPTFKAKKADKENETKPRPKQRKSLATFAAFSHEPEPEKKQKKRKLGGLGKTLFDDEDDAPSKPLPGRGAGLFAAGRLGPLVGGGVRGSFLGGAGKKKGLMTSEDGFMFSPLKKERKAMASFIQ